MSASARDLSDATTGAMRIARAYGGYVASVDMNTPGSPGQRLPRPARPGNEGRGTQALAPRQARRRLPRSACRSRICSGTANVLQRRIATLKTTIAGASSEARGYDSLTPPSGSASVPARRGEGRRSRRRRRRARAPSARERSCDGLARLFAPKPAAVPPQQEEASSAPPATRAASLRRELARLLYALSRSGRSPFSPLPRCRSVEAAAGQDSAPARRRVARRSRPPKRPIPACRSAPPPPRRRGRPAVRVELVDLSFAIASPASAKSDAMRHREAARTSRDPPRRPSGR